MISVSDITKTIPAAGGSSSIVTKAHANPTGSTKAKPIEWSITPLSNTGWITFDGSAFSSGTKTYSGDKQITISASENNTGRSRTGKYKFISKLYNGHIEQADITVTLQNNDSAPVEPEHTYNISLYPSTSSTVSADLNTINIGVILTADGLNVDEQSLVTTSVSNQTWLGVNRLGSSSSWIISVASYTGTSNRTGYVYFDYRGQRATYTVTQEGVPAVTHSYSIRMSKSDSNSVLWAAGYSDITFDLYDNNSLVQSKIAVSGITSTINSSGEGWLSVTKPNSTTCKVNWNDNITQSPRSGTIDFSYTYDGQTCTAQYTVNQGEGPANTTRSEDFFSIDVPTISVPRTGGFMDVNITAYTRTTEYNGITGNPTGEYSDSGISWNVDTSNVPVTVSVSPSSGTGNAIIKVTVDSNETSTAIDNYIYVCRTGTNTKLPIRITQPAMEAPHVYALSFSENTPWEASAASGSLNMTICMLDNGIPGNDLSWSSVATNENDLSWLTVEQGYSSSTFNVRWAANPYYESRSGSITFTYQGVSKTFVVNQEAKAHNYTVEFSSSIIDITAEAQDVKITPLLYDNGVYVGAITSSLEDRPRESWMSGGFWWDGPSSGAVRVVCDANPNYTSRSGYVDFYHTINGVTAEGRCTIRQAAKSSTYSIELSSNSWTVGEYGDNKSIATTIKKNGSVQSDYNNVTATVSIPSGQSTWIWATRTSSSSSTWNIQVSGNSGSSRIGFVSFEYNGQSASFRIELNAASPANSYSISLSKTAYTVSADGGSTTTTTIISNNDTPTSDYSNITVSSNLSWASTSVSGSTCTITASANRSGAYRSAIITFSYHGVNAQFQINQPAGADTYSIDFSGANSATFDYSGGTSDIGFYIKKNGTLMTDYLNISINVPINTWYGAVMSNNQCRITVRPHDGVNTRTGTFTCTYNGVSKTFTVTQTGHLYSIEVTPSSIYERYQSGSAIVSINLYRDGEYYDSLGWSDVTADESDSNWLTVSEVNGNIVIEWTDNEGGGEERVGYITFSYSKNGITVEPKSVTVTQSD